MRYVAFLRGMNVGGRRITNEDLCLCFEKAGFENVWAFLASGNVVVETHLKSTAKVTDLIESSLLKDLDYEVPTILRTEKELTKLASQQPFEDQVGEEGGKLQLSLLKKKPTAAQVKKVMALHCKEDQLAIIGQELYWLPIGKLTESELDFTVINKALGIMTTRTHRTIQRLSKKLATL